MPIACVSLARFIARSISLHCAFSFADVSSKLSFCGNELTFVLPLQKVVEDFSEDSNHLEEVVVYNNMVRTQVNWHPCQAASCPFRRSRVVSGTACTATRHRVVVMRSLFHATMVVMTDFYRMVHPKNVMSSRIHLLACHRNQIVGVEQLWSCTLA